MGFVWITPGPGPLQDLGKACRALIWPIETTTLPAYAASHFQYRFRGSHIGRDKLAGMSLRYLTYGNIQSTFMHTSSEDEMAEGGMATGKVRATAAVASQVAGASRVKR